MPVNLDPVIAAVQAFNEGAAQSRQRRIDEENTKQREITNKLASDRLEQEIKRETDAHNIAAETLAATLKQQHFLRRSELRKQVSDEVINIPQLEELQKIYEPLPGWVPQLGFDKPVTQSEADFANQIAGGNVVAPTVPVEGENFDIRTLATTSPRLKLEKQKHEDALKKQEELYKLKMAELNDKQAAIAAENDKKWAALMAMLGKKNETAITIKGMGNAAGEGRTSLAVDKVAIAQGNKWRDTVKKYDIPGLQTGWSIMEKNPGTLDGAEQFRIIYAFIKMADNKTGVKDAEFLAVQNQIQNYRERLESLKSNVDKDGKRIVSPELMAKLIRVMKKDKQNFQDQIQDDYETYRNTLMELPGMTQERVDRTIMNPLRDRGRSSEEAPKIPRNPTMDAEIRRKMKANPPQRLTPAEEQYGVASGLLIPQ